MRVKLRITITSVANGERYDDIIVETDAPATLNAAHYLRDDILDGLFRWSEGWELSDAEADADNDNAAGADRTSAQST